MIAGFYLPESIATSGGAFTLDQLNQLDSNDLIEQSTHSRISSETFASGAGGAVNVTANTINLAAGGQILSLTGREAIGDGGAIAVTASDINADGLNPINPLGSSGIGSYTTGAARSGDITAIADRIILTESGQIFSRTQGSGTGGNLTVRSNSLLASGVNPSLLPLQAGVLSTSLGSGRGGDVDLNSEQIDLTQASQLGTIVLSNFIGLPVTETGTGQAGNVRIQSDTMQIGGISPRGQFPLLGSVTFASGLGGNVEVAARQIALSDGATFGTGVLTSFVITGVTLPETGTGNAGDLTVRVEESLTIEGVNPFSGDPTSLATFSSGSGNLGRAQIDAASIELINGGALVSSTASLGDSGQLDVRADEILVRGVSASGLASQIGANAVTLSDTANAVLDLPPLPTGNVGRLNVSADRIEVRDGGSINVRHVGTGNAGQLQIDADRLLLDGGNIVATTAFGFGGDITIEANTLQLRNGSLLDAEAFQGQGDGGNISIQSETIAALENSDIIASSFGGDGGNITITTQGLFGTAFRPELTLESDITASSRFGLAGAVAISEPDIDSASNLVALSTETFDPTQVVTPVCASAPGDNRFVMTGRGLAHDPLNNSMGGMPLASYPVGTHGAALTSNAMDDVESQGADCSTERSIPQEATALRQDGDRIVLTAEKSINIGSTGCSLEPM